MGIFRTEEKRRTTDPTTIAIWKARKIEEDDIFFNSNASSSPYESLQSHLKTCWKQIAVSYPTTQASFSEDTTQPGKRFSFTPYLTPSHCVSEHAEQHPISLPGNPVATPGWNIRS